MVIQHNLSAMVASMYLNNNIMKQSKVTQRLSSGYRINRACDDAAGLSISEKMRKQIRGLTQGVKNTEDAISLCQVADGALSEVHEMLQRMNELSIKAANGTMSDSDRSHVNNEVQNLIKEIDRIASTTKFNETYIFQLGMNHSGSNRTEPTTNGKIFQLLAGSISATGYMDEDLPLGSVPDSQATFMMNFWADNPTNPYVSSHIDFSPLGTNLSQLSGCQFYANCCTDDCPKIVKFTDSSGITYTTGFSVGGENLSEINIGLKKADGTYYDDAQKFNKYIVDTLRDIIDINDPNHVVDNEHVQFAYQGSTLYILDVDNNNWSPTDKKLAYFCDSEPAEAQPSGKTSIWIQTGADAYDGLNLYIDHISSNSLGIYSVNTATQEHATEAIDSVADAIKKVSANRSKIGAYQNRFEHTVRNQNNIIENTTNAESRIRDTDMAKEMVEYSKNQILIQVGQVILAQANQQKSGVLQLLL